MQDEVSRLAVQHQFEKAYALDKAASDKPTVLWSYAFDGNSTLLSTTKFRFVQRSHDVEGIPRLSPDGRTVALRCDTTPPNGPGDMRRSDLLLLDLHSGGVKQIPCGSDRGINYDFACWSPDSRYLAYFVGGFATGEVEVTIGMSEQETIHEGLELWIYDTLTGRKALITANDTIRGPLTWLAPHRLLYGQLEEPQKGKNEPRSIPRPNIFVYTPEENASKLLIPNAYFPTASADGQWIACFGPKEEKAPYPFSEWWRFEPKNVPLCVCKSDGSERTVVGISGIKYPQLCWSVDDKTLFRVDDAQSLGASAQISAVDIASGAKKQLAVIGASGAGEQDLLPSEFQFPLVGLATNGKELLFWRTSYPDAKNYSLRHAVLTGIDLGTGKTRDLVGLQGACTFSWLEAKNTAQ